MPLRRVLLKHTAIVLFVAFHLLLGLTWGQTEIMFYGFGLGHGLNPAASLILGGKGNLYGATIFGDAPNVEGDGTVLEVPAAGTATATTITTSGSPSHVGEVVTVRASVSSNKGVPPDGEQVTFKEVTTQTVLGTAPLSSGVAQFATSSLPRGTLTIKAKYPGDATFALSSATLTQVVHRYPTSPSLTSSPNPCKLGQAVTFTVRVTTTGPNAPTGTVTFYKGATVLGTAPVNAPGTASVNTPGTAAATSAGVAALTVSTIGVGAHHQITAVYSGDTFNKVSTSPVLIQIVN